jgi:hypothetical protein
VDAGALAKATPARDEIRDRVNAARLEAIRSALY